MEHTTERKPDPRDRPRRVRARALLDARRDPATPLPHRTSLEAAFGLDLSALITRRGGSTDAALAAAGAGGAAVAGEVWLPSGTVAVDVVAHEVAHALGQTGVPGVELWGSAAEQAAVAPEPVADTTVRSVAFLDLWGPPRDPPRGAVDPARWLDPRVLAATLDAMGLRPPSEPTVTPAATEPQPSEALESPVNSASQPQAAPTERETKAAPSEEPATKAGARPHALEPQEQPADTRTGALPPGATPSDAIQAFGALPASLQAEAFPGVGTALQHGTAAEAKALVGAVAAPQVVTEGEAAPAALVSAVVADNTPLEAITIPSTQPPTVDAPPLDAAESPLEGASQVLDGASAEATAADKAARAAAVFSAAPVAAEHPSVATPTLTLSGGADPALIAEAGASAQEHASATDAAFTQAMASAPQASDLVPVATTATAELPPVAEPPAVDLPDVEGMAAYRAMNLPPAAQAVFDEGMRASSDARAEEARKQVTDAAAARDVQRDAAEAKAEGEVDAARIAHRTAEDAAISKQRTAIDAAHTTADEGRADAMRDMRSELDTEAGVQRDAISSEIGKEQTKVDDVYAKAESDAREAEAKTQKDLDAEQKATQSETGESSWWDRGVDLVKSAIDAYVSVVTALLDGLRSLVKGIYALAAEVANAAIQAVTELAAKAVKAYASFVKSVVDGVLGEVFPGLARALNAAIDAAADLYVAAIEGVGGVLQAAVTAVAESLAAAVDGVLGAYTTFVQTAGAVYKAGLDGDWSEALRLAVEAMVLAFGLDPVEFFGLVGTAEDVWQTIVDDPVGFGKNVLSAAFLGLTQFGDNILTHLQTGFVAWLTGAFAGQLTLPAEWDLLGVLDVARQVMGLTVDNLLKLARTALPGAAVDAIEWVIAKVETLVEGGWSGLWDELMADLQGLVEAIIPEILTWAVEQLVKAALPKLLAFLDPTFIAAIVTALQVMWGAYEFLRDQFQRLYGVVKTVVEAMAALSSGVIQPSADKIEGLLGEGVPLVLDLLAKLLGVNVASGVRGVLDKARDWVEKAIIKLAKGFLAMFKVGGAGEGAQAEEGAVDFGTLAKKLAVTLPDGQVHHLYVHGQAGSFELYLASVEGPAAESAPAREDPAVRAAVAVVDQTLAEVNDEAKDPTPTKAEETELRADVAEVGAEEKAVVAAMEEGATVDAVESGLERCDRDARADIEAVVRKAMTTGTALEWPEIMKRVRQELPDLFERPLAQEHRFGTAAHVDQAVPAMKLVIAGLGGATDDAIVSRKVSAYKAHMDPSTKETLGQQVFEESKEPASNAALHNEYQKRLTADAEREHDNYLPVTLTWNEARTQVTYTTKAGSSFVVDIDPTTGAVKTVAGSNLQHKRDVGITNRGVTQDSPGHMANREMDRAHLVADEFLGSGYARSLNIITTSAHFNRVVMRRQEEQIGKTWRDFVEGVREEEADAEATFDLTVSVEWMELIGPTAVAEIEGRLGGDLLAKYADWDKDILSTKIDDLLRTTFAGHSSELRRVGNVIYKMVIIAERAPKPGPPLKTGPDVWLGILNLKPTGS